MDYVHQYDKLSIVIDRRILVRNCSYINFSKLISFSLVYCRGPDPQVQWHEVLAI